ncbi:hypothetical protein B0H17DRAFT_1126718 [Mycena rosella]|uniref:Uncharacterized protein n=1 Tax=Mycena rosella TaxID=1033263 RepID=A0AAD7GSI4_MYCRO|nr:hypothetical protein B0H17DRAFT_1126718 [Mycena rosella]
MAVWVRGAWHEMNVKKIQIQKVNEVPVGVECLVSVVWRRSRHPRSAAHLDLRVSGVESVVVVGWNVVLVVVAVVSSRQGKPRSKDVGATRHWENQIHAYLSLTRHIHPCTGSGSEKESRRRDVGAMRHQQEGDWGQRQERVGTSRCWGDRASAGGDCWSPTGGVDWGHRSLGRGQH